MNLVKTDVPASKSPCASEPCLNGCRCVDSCKRENGFECIGGNGYFGNRCEKHVANFSCDSHYITLQLPKSFGDDQDSDRQGGGSPNYYIGSGSDDSNSRSDRCRVSPSKEVVIPVGECDADTSLVENGTVISVTNTLWSDDGGKMARVLVPVFNFSCIYPLTLNLISALRPTLEKSAEFLEKYENYSSSMSLCKKESCESNCLRPFEVNGRAMYTVGERIHARIALFSEDSALPSSSWQAYLDELHLSCSSDRDHPESVVLIEQGCPTTDGEILSVQPTSHNSTQTACFSFNVPRFPNCYQFFIHATVGLCHHSADASKSCLSSPNARTCRQSSRKRRRAGDDGAPSRYSSTLGPLYVLPVLTYNQMKYSEVDQSSLLAYSIAGLVVTVLIGLSLLTVALYLYQNYRRQKTRLLPKAVSVDELEESL